MATRRSGGRAPAKYYALEWVGVYRELGFDRPDAALALRVAHGKLALAHKAVVHLPLVMESKTIFATLLLSSQLMASDELGEQFGATISAAPCFAAVGSAVNWAHDTYYSNRFLNVDEEDIHGAWWTDEVEPRARRIFEAGGIAAVDAFYVVALVLILDDYWTLGPELVADDRAPALTKLRDLARRGLGEPETLPATVRDAGASLARAWRATVDRLARERTTHSR